MNLSATFYGHLFQSLLTLYIVMECTLTLRHIHKLELVRDNQPEVTKSYWSEARWKKAVHFSIEGLHHRLFLTMMAAVLALMMTYGKGLNILITLANFISSGITSQWLVIAAITFILVGMHYPLTWWTQFRYKESFGVEPLTEERWRQKTFLETAAGLSLFLPFIAAGLWVFEITGTNWWWTLWMMWVGLLSWRWIISLRYGLYWGRRARPYLNPEMKVKIMDFLAQQGTPVCDVVVTTRPVSWRRGFVVLTGFGKHKRCVIFAQVVKKVKGDALMALIARESQKARHHHAWWRLLAYSLLGALGAYFTASMAGSSAFFEGLGVSSFLTTNRGGTHAGYTVAVLLVTYPIWTYFFRPFIFTLNHALQWDADRKAIETFGAPALYEALVTLRAPSSLTISQSRSDDIFHTKRLSFQERLESLVRHFP